MLCSTFDRYSFRPYFPGKGDRILAKLTVVIDGEYVLVTDSNGRHYEEFCNLTDPPSLVHVAMRARCGILGGHKPFLAKPMRQHAGKQFSHTVKVSGKGRKYLVRRGGGVFDRVIDIGADGLSTGLSYLVSAKDVSDEQPVYFGMVGVDL